MWIWNIGYGTQIRFKIETKGNKYEKKLEDLCVNHKNIGTEWFENIREYRHIIAGSSG